MMIGCPVTDQLWVSAMTPLARRPIPVPWSWLLLPTICSVQNQHLHCRQQTQLVRARSHQNPHLTPYSKACRHWWAHSYLGWIRAQMRAQSQPLYHWTSPMTSITCYIERSRSTGPSAMRFIQHTDFSTWLAPGSTRTPNESRARLHCQRSCSQWRNSWAVDKCSLQACNQLGVGQMKSSCKPWARFSGKWLDCS